MAESYGTDAALQHDRAPEQAASWRAQGLGAALATVVRTWGSAPRPVGAQLAVSSEAALAGSVSGGCVESAVAAEALEALADGRPRLLTFGVSDDDAFAVGLACGGEIQIFVDPIGVGDGMPADDLDRLTAARAARQAIGYVHGTDGRRRGFLAPEDAPDAFSADRSGYRDEAASQVLTIHNPPLRLAIVGAAHIAQALAPMARLAGYDVTVIDPREAFATEARFPGHRLGRDLSHAWPDDALADFGLDARTAVVCLTHDPKIDDPALEAALASDAFYIGALGSMRTHAKRVARFAERGVGGDAFARVHAPVGLDIGAKSPGEIAVAVLAEMTERLRRPETRPARAAAAG